MATNSRSRFIVWGLRLGIAAFWALSAFFLWSTFPVSPLAAEFGLAGLWTALLVATILCSGLLALLGSLSPDEDLGYYSVFFACFLLWVLALFPRLLNLISYLVNWVN